MQPGADPKSAHRYDNRIRFTGFQPTDSEAHAVSNAIGNEASAVDTDTLGSGGKPVLGPPEATPLAAAQSISQPLSDAMPRCRTPGVGSFRRKFISSVLFWMLALGFLITEMPEAQAAKISDCSVAYQDLDTFLTPNCFDNERSDKITEESEASVIRDAARYFSRTVSNRVRALLAVSKGGFSPPTTSPTTSRDTPTGINAGGDTLPSKGIDNVAIDIGASDTRSKGRFESESQYVLVTTDRVLDTKSVVGFGLGIENSRGSVQTQNLRRRAEGLTLTAYGARILNEKATLVLVPQVAVTYLRKNTENSDGKQRAKAWRTMGSLVLLGQRALDTVELTGFGQLVYTYEDTSGGDSLYVGQGVLNGEVAFVANETAQPFLGVTGSYDLVRSASTSERLGYEASVGIRSAQGSKPVISASISYARRGDEKTKSINLFLKFFW